jgi:mono/diheme cytochrome c family protein
MFKHERLVLCMIFMTLLAACGTPAVPGPTLAPTQALPTRVPIQVTGRPQNESEPTVVGAQPTSAPTLAPVTPAAANPSPTIIPATPTRSFATATRVARPAGDPAKGQVLFNNSIGDPLVPICNTCHLVDSEEVKVGPSLKGVAGHGDEHAHAQGQDLATYLRTSIVNPNAYLVPNQDPHLFSVNGVSLMYQDYAKHLSEEQINDLVAYLMTLK